MHSRTVLPEQCRSCEGQFDERTHRLDLPVEAAERLQQVIGRMHAGEEQTLVVGMGHGTCTCEGAAFEYVFNVDHQLREAGVRHVLLAGRPGPELDGVVDDHLAAGQDVLAVLERTRSALEGDR